MIEGQFTKRIKKTKLADKNNASNFAGLIISSLLMSQSIIN